MSKLSPRLLLVFTSLAHTFSHLLMLLYPTVVLVMGDVYQLDYDQLIALALPGFILFGAGALPAGWLADRWSSRGMMAIFFLGTGAGTVFAGCSRTPFELSVGLALIGLFASIYHPVGIAWLVGNAVNPGRALGINGVFGSIGTASGALVAGGLADMMGWRAAFVIPGVFCVIAGVMFLLLYRGASDTHSHAKLHRVEHVTGNGLRRALMLMAFTTVMIGLIYQSATVGLPKLLTEKFPELDTDMFGVGLLVGVIFIVSGVTQVLGGELADRFQLKSIYVFGLLAGVPFSLFAYVAGQYWFVVAMAAVMGTQTIVMPAENSLLASYTPSEWRARVFGAKFVLTLGVSSLGVALIPFLHNITGTLNTLPFLICIMALAGGLVACRLPQQNLRGR